MRGLGSLAVVGIVVHGDYDALADEVREIVSVKGVPRTGDAHEGDVVQIQTGASGDDGGGEKVRRSLAYPNGRTFTDCARTDAAGGGSAWE